ncbi:MAG TPA: GNAT family N-acetyltransferase [Edaphocola sp.]|nr:GNAT family N-acetyltransferase [Edaphocola sp.]
MHQSYYKQNTALLAQLPVFYQPWYLDTIGIPWEVLIHEEQGEPVLIWVYSKEKKGPFCFNRAQAAYFQIMCGPYFLKELPEAEKLRIIHTTYSKLPRATFEQYLPICSQNIDQFFASRHFEIVPKITHIIDLSLPIEEIYQQIKTKRRKKIEKGLRELSIVARPIQPQMAHAWMNQAIQKNKGRISFTAHQFAKLQENAINNGASFSLEARNQDNELVAVLWTLYDQQAMYNLVSALNYDIMNSYAISAMLWKAIEKARELGLRYFDFEGSKIPGVAELYRSFGATVIQYNSFQKTNSLLWKLKRQLLG